MLLLRGRADLDGYVRALEEHGVPVAGVVGSDGMYSTVEIQDLLSVMRLLDSPLDDGALLTALRSPCVGARFDTIYRLGMLARDDGESSYARSMPLATAIPALLAWNGLPESEREKLQPFLVTLEALRPEVDRISVGRLMDRLIHRLSYDKRLLCRTNGRQKLANVRRLVQIALDNPELTLSRFLDRIEEMQKVEEFERQTAVTDAVPGAVRVMTIHAAKGLEFPVVVLPDLSRGITTTDSDLFLFDTASGRLGTRVAGQPDAAYVALAHQKRASEREEFLRLLYVGMTRACERLILAGNIGRNRGLNWADEVFGAIGLTEWSGQAARKLLDNGLEAMVYPIEGPATVSIDVDDPNTAKPLIGDS